MTTTRHAAMPGIFVEWKLPVRSYLHAEASLDLWVLDDPQALQTQTRLALREPDHGQTDRQTDNRQADRQADRQMRNRWQEREM